MYIVIALLVLLAIAVFMLNSRKDKEEERNTVAVTEEKANAREKVQRISVEGTKQCFMVFDTETCGLSPEDNDILQLSYLIVDRNTLKVIKEVDKFFPWPEDKSRVEIGAIKVNGLTEKFLAKKVLSNRKDAIRKFYEDMRTCTFIVAHNGDFDKKFIIATAKREGLPYSTLEWPVMIDTMKTTTDLCQLPPHPGRTGYKWPKLIELAECLRIKTDDINLHDSSADVELTKRCFLYLLEKKFYNV